MSCSYGQHHYFVFINASTLLESKCVIKTQLGISKSFYKHSELSPIYGTGQGPGNCPAIWYRISFTSFDLYKEHAKGTCFQSPDSLVMVQIYIIGFVNDTSGNMNDFMLPHALPPDHNTDLTTHNAQCWNGML